MTTTTIEQLPASVNLHLLQGDTFVRRLHFYNVDGDVDISSWTIAAQVRRFASAGDATAFAIALVTDGTDGLVDIALTADQTHALNPTGVWDLQRTANGNTLTLMGGTVTIDREVTR